MHWGNTSIEFRPEFCESERKLTAYLGVHTLPPHGSLCGMPPKWQLDRDARCRVGQPFLVNLDGQVQLAFAWRLRAPVLEMRRRSRNESRSLVALAFLLLSQAVRGNYTCMANEYCTVDGACQAGDPSKCEACPDNAYSSGNGTYRTCICGPGYTPAVNILESVSEPRLRLATTVPVSSHDQIKAGESICARVEVSFPVTSSRSGHTYPEGTWGTVLDQANTFLLGSGEEAKHDAVPIICGQMGLSAGRAFVTSSFNAFHPATGPIWIRFERNDPGALHDSAAYDHTDIHVI